MIRCQFNPRGDMQNILLRSGDQNSLCGVLYCYPTKSIIVAANLCRLWCVCSLTKWPVLWAYEYSGRLTCH